MQPVARKLALTTHVICAVGWLGAVAAYLAPAIVALGTTDLAVVRACHLAMGVIAWFVIVPLAIATLVTGFVQSLATEWGVLRHYWIVAKLGLAVLGTAVLLGHMRTVDGLAALTPQALEAASAGRLEVQLVVHAAGGLVVLVVATTLSIVKPWGRTAYGRRRAR